MLLPHDLHVELCYRCKCGCIHWVETRVKDKSIKCYCGNVLHIQPLSLPLNIVLQQINLTKLRKILSSQGYTRIEIDKMTIGINKENNLEELLKSSLSNLL